MDVKITGTKENALMGRKEVSVTISFEKATPPRKEIKEVVSGKMGANPESVVIRSIRSKFGTRSVDALLHVYPTKEAALAGEPNHVLVRDGMVQKKPKEDAKKAALAAAKKK